MKLRVFLLLIMSFIALVVLLKVYDYFKKCGTDHIKAVCQDYQRGVQNGSFCRILCEEEILEPQRCHTVSIEKAVHEIHLDGRPVIVKFILSSGKNDSASGEWRIFSEFNNSGWSVNYYGHCGCIYAVEPVLYTAGKVYGSAELLVDLLFIPDPLVHIIEILAESMPELPYSIVHYQKQLSGFLSKTVYHVIHQIRVPSLKEKVDFIRNIFLMLERFTRSTEGKILMCDVHIDNFGCTDKNEVKIIDGDHLFYIEDVKKILSQKTCVNDLDCKVGDSNDCSTRCNKTSSSCITDISLSNVRNLCKVIIDFIMHYFSEYELNIVRKSYEIMKKLSIMYSKNYDEEISKIMMVITSLKDSQL